MREMIRKTYDMERLIFEAYDNAKSNEFFAITNMLERLIDRRYSLNDPRGDITTGAVRQVLDDRGMNYTLDRGRQKPGVNSKSRIDRRRGRPRLTISK